MGAVPFENINPENHFIYNFLRKILDFLEEIQKLRGEKKSVFEHIL